MAKRKQKVEAEETQADEVVRARVRVDCQIGGERYKPNDIVSAPVSVIKAEEKAGRVDSHPNAVAAAERL